MAGGSNKRVFVELLGSSTGAVRAFEATALAADEAQATMGSKFEEGGQKVEGVFSKLGNAMSNLGLPLGPAVADIGAKFGELETKGQKLNGVMSEVGKATLAGGLVAFAGAAYEGVKGAMALQKSMELLHTQAGASQAEVRKMTSAVESMAGSVGTGPEELATGLYHIESAGFRGANALSILKIAAEGAKVGNANLEDVTNALDASVISGMKGVGNYGKTMGQLNAIVGAGDMKMQDLADAMGSGITAVAGRAGISMTDLGAALATFGDNNIRGEKAAIYLRQALLSMDAPSKAAAGALASIGIGSTQLGNDLRQPNGLLVALEDVKKHLDESGQSAVQQAATLSKAFGGVKSSTGMEILMGQMDRLKSKYKEVADGGTKFGTDWAATQQTLSFRMDQLKATIEGLADRFGNFLIPKLQDVANIVAKVIDWFEKHKAAAMALGVVIGGVLASAVAVYAVNTGVKMVNATRSAVSSIGSLVSSLFGQRTAQDETAANAEATSTAIQESQAAIERSNLLLQANAEETSGVFSLNFSEMGARADALAAQVGVAMTEIDASLAGVGTAEETTATVAEAAGPEISAGLGPVGIAIAGIGLAATLLASHWKTVWKDVRTVAVDAWHFLDSDVIAPLKRGWDDLWGGIKTVAGDAWHFLENTVFLPWKLEFDVIRDALTFLGSHWSDIWNGIKTVASDVWKFLDSTFFQPILSILDTIKSAIDAVSNAFSKIGGIASSIGHGIGGAVSGIAHVFRLATGGIVNQPTLAVVGEAGPEMVIPLSTLGNFRPGGPAPLPLPASLGAQGALAGGSTQPIIQQTNTFQVAASLDNPQTRAQLQQMIDQSHRDLAALVENTIRG